MTVAPAAPPEEQFGVSLTTPPMEARAAEALPEGEGWRYEPKWDGFRCLAFKAGDAVELRAKSGKPLGRYFPEVVRFLRSLKVDRFVLDGELVIEIDGRLSFDALQMRLHPAESRIRKLSAATPAQLILFDMLVSPDGGSLIAQPLAKRRLELERFAGLFLKTPDVSVSRFTDDPDEAGRWLADAGHGATDGVVAKRLDGPYAAGERAMVKVKRCAPRTALSAASGTRARDRWSARCCSGSMIPWGGWITSASPRRSPTPNGRS